MTRKTISRVAVRSQQRFEDNMIAAALAAGMQRAPKPEELETALRFLDDIRDGRVPGVESEALEVLRAVRQSVLDGRMAMRVEPGNCEHCGGTLVPKFIQRKAAGA